MGFGLGRLTAFFGLAMIAIAASFGASPAYAMSQESRVESLREEIHSFAAELKARSETLIAATADTVRRTVEDNRDTIDDIQSDLAGQLASLRALLNEQKAKFDMIGEDAAAELDDWTRKAAETWAEMHRSALEALDWLQHWLEQYSGSDDPIHV